MDWPIKQTLINSNSDECGERTFCGINSYNIGRPLVQMVHFVSVFLGGEMKCAELRCLTHSNLLYARLDLDLLANGRAIGH